MIRKKGAARKWYAPLKMSGSDPCGLTLKSVCQMLYLRKVMSESRYMWQCDFPSDTIETNEKTERTMF